MPQRSALTHCNCESSACEHGEAPCSHTVDESSERMDWVGRVCIACASVPEHRQYIIGARA